MTKLKFLGVVLDTKLLFESQIRSIGVFASSKLVIMKKLLQHSQIILENIQLELTVYLVIIIVVNYIVF